MIPALHGVSGRHTSVWRHGRTAVTTLLAVVALVLLTVGEVGAQTSAEVPALTREVNDFARVVDAGSDASLTQTIRALQAASGDVIVVATVPTVAPYADVREYAVKMFQNGGRGIGERGKDNGLLVLLALQERRVWVEVGYGLEPFITDGFSGQVSRDVMTPAFRSGNYGAGLAAGVAVLAQRIAQGRNVQLTGIPAAPIRQRRAPERNANWLLILFVVLVVLSRFTGGGPRGGVRRWGRGGWSGWSSGVGPFGGGFGGGGFGGGGGGFGGGFGGFGGGRSGGGGGGSSW